MALSRKRTKQLRRLQGDAEDLWQSQRRVLDQANDVVREARHQLRELASEEVTPRVRDAYESRVKPTLATGIAAGRHVASGARDRVNRGILPSVSTALGSAAAVIEIARDPRVREAVRSGKSIRRQRKGVGPLSWIGIIFGAVTLAGLGYAVWQTLRADEELWVEAEEAGEAI